MERGYDEHKSLTALEFVALSLREAKQHVRSLKKRLAPRPPRSSLRAGVLVDTDCDVRGGPLACLGPKRPDVYKAAVAVSAVTDLAATSPWTRDLFGERPLITMVRITLPLLRIFIAAVWVLNAAGPAAADGPNCCISSIVADSKGNLFVNAHDSVARVTPDGRVTDIMPKRSRAESRERPFASKYLAIDDQDVIYTSGGSRVYKVFPDGSFTILAGNGTAAWIDGTGSAASFQNTQHIAVDARHNVYVVDYSPRQGQRLRKVTPAGVVTTVKDGAGTPIGSGHSIDGLAIDAAGDVIYSSLSASCIRSLAPDGSITVLAGSKGTCGGPHDSKSFREGPVARVMLWYPASLTVGEGGDIYFNDEFLRRLIKISKGRVTVVAGNSAIDQTGAYGTVQGGTEPGYRDGQAREALFTHNRALAFDRAGNLWIVDSIAVPGGIIRKLSPDGIVSTFLR